MKAGNVPTFSEVYSRLERELSPDAFSHSVRTATLARTLAKEHEVDQDRSELAALVHDVAADYSDVELLALAERYRIPIGVTEERTPALLHGPIGAEILREAWSIEDDEILDAVRTHITGSTVMSPLAKVVFAADKLEPGRDRYYGGLQPVRELATQDIDAAILRLYAWRTGELVASGHPVHDPLMSAQNDLVERAIAERPE